MRILDNSKEVQTTPSGLDYEALRTLLAYCKENPEFCSKTGEVDSRLSRVEHKAGVRRRHIFLITAILRLCLEEGDDCDIEHTVDAMNAVEIMANSHKTKRTYDHDVKSLIPDMEGHNQEFYTRYMFGRHGRKFDKWMTPFDGTEKVLGRSKRSTRTKRSVFAMISGILRGACVGNPDCYKNYQRNTQTTNDRPRIEVSES